MLSLTPSGPPTPAVMCSSKQTATFGCLEQETDSELALDNPFGLLIDELRAVLGKSGLASSDIDVSTIKAVMDRYVSDERDWGRFALSDASRGYTRNGIVNINGNANLLILVWTPGKGSAIHDHANAHCCMKILKGELVESLYDVPATEGHVMVPRKETVLHRNDVGYISDQIGLHKISNASLDEYAVSLHLYTPPYASLYGCSMYESNTAVKHHVNMSKYHSWQGVLVNAKDASTC